jgi:hypothetical protein
MRAIAVVLVALALASTAGAASPRPVLRISGDSPMILRGANFSAHERVTLVLSVPKPIKLAVVTNANGAFRLRLPVVSRLGRCGSFIVSALGSRGERAVAGMGTLGCTSPGVKIPGNDT